MNHNDIIDKVKKILRKADKSKNSSIEEAESALKMAHNILKKYHLSMSQILSIDDTEKDSNSSIDLVSQVGATFKASSVPKWMSILISAINQITQTKNLIRYGKPEGQKQYGNLHILFVGDETDVLVATDLFSFLRNSITKLSSSHIKKTKTGFRQWRSFAEGCACKLLSRSLKYNSENIWNQDETKKCNIDNFIINEDDEIEENDLNDEETVEEEENLNIEDREISEEEKKDQEQKYEIFLISKQKKIDDYIKEMNKNQRIEKEEISNSNKLDQRSFLLGSKAADKIPLKIQKQLVKNK